VYRKLTDVPQAIDLVNVFRRSNDVAKHAEDILAKKPKAVWMQSGIRNDEVAETLAKEGIKVVQDLCLMVEHRSLG
ncbi:MAG TPA: CoA-binding protein, partial [Pyrinomonadaceae bacterium]